jgi:hypothetical protein
MAGNRTLPQIAKAIKALEKKSIQNVIEIGRLLHEASGKCEHGEFMPWLESEFGWSHDTSLNYRNVYHLSENPKFSDFTKLDISVSALYRVAHLLSDDGSEHQAIALAVIEAARQGRVSYKMACAIIDDALEEQRRLLDAKLDDEQHRRLVELAEADPSKMEQKYTDLIKKRSLYEGACSLPWAQYFEYRAAHPDCTPLTPNDLAYTAQWTPLAATASTAEPDPPGDGGADDDAEPDAEPDDEPSPPAEPPPVPNKLMATMNDLIGVSERDPAWDDVIADIGTDALQRIIATLVAVYGRHSGSSAADRKVKAAADRAEAASRERV